MPLAPEFDPIHKAQKFAGQKRTRRPSVQDSVQKDQGGDQNCQSDCEAVSNAPCSLVEELTHGCGHIGHAHGETPFIVIPGQHAHGALADHLGLIWSEDR